jgi:hypothetical protein
VSSEETPQTGETPETEQLTFDSWIGQQPDEVRNLLETHTTGLTSALKAERDSRKALEKQVKTLAEQAEQGSAAANQLMQVSQELQEAERRATFTETAVASGVQPGAIRLAYLAANDLGAWQQDGAPDLSKLKSAYPHLFTKATPTPTAGAGTNGQLPAVGNPMDNIIRAKAGRI